MAGRRKKSDKSKTSKQERLIFVVEYLLEDWLNIKEISFSWLVDIYKDEFGYESDNDDAVEIAIKRDLSLLIKQGLIDQHSDKSTFIKDSFWVSERLKTAWGSFEHKNKKLQKYLEEKYKDEKNEEIKEDKIYEEYAEDAVSAFDIAVQVVQAIMFRETDIEKDIINRGNRHFFPFDIVVARNHQEEI